MRCSVPRRLRTITRSREGGVTFAGGRSPSVRTTVPSVGVVCLKWVRRLFVCAVCWWIYRVHTHSFLRMNEILRLDHHCPCMGAKCIVSRLLATIELNRHPPLAAWARETEPDRCWPAGLPNVPLFPSLPRIRHLPGSLRLYGMHPRAHLCV